MPSPNHRGEDLSWKPASSREMQAPNSRVPPAKSRDSVQKQRSNVWNGPSPIATFVRCLRLLDLDLLEDWPGISEHTFSTLSAKQNLQARIKCVEWSLFRLFELWSSSETRDKLRPFFPPLTPLQSLNLRAALYRALTDLKKNGVLRKEVLLRKTMLDECKGEKFEEVISAFAMTVLRKVAQARDDARLDLPCSDRLTARQEAQLLPLIIAHRCSLQQKISQHRKIQGHAKVYNGLLAQRHASNEDRRAQLSKLLVPEEGQEDGTIEHIADSWLGDNRWAEILVSGPMRFEDQILEAPFQTGWKTVLDEKNVDIGHKTDLLEDLIVKIANQETRLRKWKTFAASLRNTQVRRQHALTKRDSPKNYDSAVLQFDRHQSLHISDKRLPAPFADHHLPTTSNHKILLASMDTDLASLGRRNRAKPFTAREDPRKEHRTFLEHEQVGEETPEGPHKLLKYASKTSSVLSAFTSASHRSQDLSTLGHSRYKNTSVRSTESTSIARQQVESEPPGISAPLNSLALKDFSQTLIENQSHEAHILAQSAAHPTLVGLEQSLGIDVVLSEASSLQREPDKHKVMQKSSTDATNTSMPFATEQDNHEMEEQIGFFPSEHHVTPLKRELESIMTGQHGTRAMTPLPTLLERTRRSMSLRPNPAGRAGLRSSEKRLSSKQTRLSQAFPINQFETPRKVKTSETSRLEARLPRSGSSTPRDELFSDAAAYDSVFKSRPRIALSPALSPDRSGMGLDSMLENDLADLTLEGDL